MEKSQPPGSLTLEPCLTALRPGVDGLEVIIAEAGISSWYNYYRENGLVTSPGGYPGEDFGFPCRINLFTQPSRWGLFTPQCGSLADLDRVKKSWTELETTITWHDRNYLRMLIGLQLRWSLPMAPKTGTLSRFTSLTCSKPLPANQETPLLLPQWCPCLPQQLAIH